MKIHFLGASGTVTGSKYLVETETKNILVDCGLFQGLKDLRLKNWDKLSFNEADIDLVLLTHGHLDHTGYLPRLVSAGYIGEIWGTAPTLEVAKIILEDSARIQEEDAERANREGFSKHTPAIPLYGEIEVVETLKGFRPKPLNKWIEIDEHISCCFHYNGHIIGACYIELKIGAKTLVFSGDIGRRNDELMYPPQKPENADVLFIESTYGDRLHPDNGAGQLKQVILRSIERHGTIIIPSFAVERTQSLMYLLWKLRSNGEIPYIPVYMDSPMGSKVLDVFEHNFSWHKLSAEECTEMCRDIREVRTIQETHRLSESKKAKIIIAGSGMVSGGRVLTYLTKFIGDPNATVILVGFQAEGTRGRALLEGAKEIKLYGKYFKVRAFIERIDGLSSHADQAGLVDWMSSLGNRPEKIFIVHGEKHSSEELQKQLLEHYNLMAEIPYMNQIVQIDEGLPNQDVKNEVSPVDVAKEKF